MTAIKYGDVYKLDSLEPVGTAWDDVLVSKWMDEDRAAGSRPMSNPAKPIRHSWAGKCARQMAYFMIERKAPPMDRNGIWVTSLGTRIHELWQQALESRNLGPASMQFEVECETDVSSGHADALAITSSKIICAELKTINGMGYKQVLRKGPRLSHLLQGCINGYALDADRVALVYLPMETNRQAIKSLQIGCTFFIERDHMVEIAERELQRWRKIIQTVDRGFLPPRQIVDDNVRVGSVVDDPMSGKLDTVGKTWQCGYCPFQMGCMSDGGGLVRWRKDEEMEDLWTLPN